MIAQATLLTKHPDVACRTVGGSALALSTAARGPNPVLMTFNKTGTLIWNLLDGRTDVGTVLARLAERYPHVPSDRRAAETCAFLERLIQAGLLVESRAQEFPHGA